MEKLVQKRVFGKRVFILEEDGLRLQERLLLKTKESFMDYGSLPMEWDKVNIRDGLGTVIYLSFMMILLAYVTVNSIMDQQWPLIVFFLGSFIFFTLIIIYNFQEHILNVYRVERPGHEYRMLRNTPDKQTVLDFIEQYKHYKKLAGIRAYNDLARTLKDEAGLQLPLEQEVPVSDREYYLLMERIRNLNIIITCQPEDFEDDDFDF